MNLKNMIKKRIRNFSFMTGGFSIGVTIGCIGANIKSSTIIVWFIEYIVLFFVVVILPEYLERKFGGR